MLIPMTMTPELVLGTVEMVDVAWILQNATHSVDCDEDEDNGVPFEYMIQWKATESGFGNLVNAIMTQGFRVPIVLDLGYNGEGTVTIGNGHHRLSAAILLCLDAIPVFWANDDYMSSDESDHGEPEECGWEDLPKFIYDLLHS